MYNTNMPKLGQHFLRDAGALRRIASALEIEAGDSIVEIGPGHGELTRFLLPRAKEAGAELVLVEKDRRLAVSLLGSLGSEPVRIVHEDALRAIPGIAKKASALKLAGNLPYYLSGRLFRLLYALEPRPELSVFTLQKEVAERIAAKPPRMNRLAASVQFWAEPEILGNLPARSFLPPPKVDSAIIRLRRKREAAPVSPERFDRILGLLFRQPRKTVRNNIASGTDREKAEKMLGEAGISGDQRPQDLGMPEIFELARVYPTKDHDGAANPEDRGRSASSGTYGTFADDL